MIRVVGLGTGRCGTLSLATMLGRQPMANVTHERTPALFWNNEPCPTRHLELDENKAHTIYGDVGFYYLPHVLRIWDRFPETKFVCLKRDMHATVASFERYLSPTCNHWTTPRDNECARWDRSYPRIWKPTRTECIQEYWLRYYDKAERLQADYTGNFRIFMTETMNTEEGVKSIFEWLGVEAEKTTPVWVKHHR
jgi:hypothetical protein